MVPSVWELKKKLIEKYGDRLVRFILFGSTVRGENTAESDIDIFVTLTGAVNWELEKEILHLVFEIELEHNVILDVHVYSEEDIQNTIIGATPLIENVLKEGIPL